MIVKMTVCCSGEAGLNSMTDSPHSSVHVLQPVTVSNFRTHVLSACVKFQAVSILASRSFRLEAWPIPHTSATSMMFNASTLSSSVPMTDTPSNPKWVRGNNLFFANRFATFANVLVDATPIDTGIPTRFQMVSRICEAIFANLVMGKPDRSTKDSSIEYTSISGTIDSMVCITTARCRHRAYWTRIPPSCVNELAPWSETITPVLYRALYFHGASNATIIVG